MRILFPKPEPDPILEEIRWQRFFPASEDALEKCKGMDMIDIRGAIRDATVDFIKLAESHGPEHTDTQVVAAVLNAAMSVFHEYKLYN